MRKLFFGLFLSGLAQVALSQCTITYTTVYDSSLQTIMASTLVEDDQLVLAGFYDGETILGADTLPQQDSLRLYLAKTDTNQNYLWAQAILGTGYLLATDMVATDTGDILLTGIFTDTLKTVTDTLVSAGGRDGFVIKFDS